MNTMAQRHAICISHGKSIETVTVECVSCGACDKKRFSHAASDIEIARKCFPRWRIKGVRRARKTLCPKCKP